MKTLRKILVVDDDPVVGKSFDRVLSGRGYAVVTASDGDEALRKIAAEEYDVVFTDIRMPGMDGIAVAEHIRDRQPWLPVVIVSGYATAANEARARAAGVSAVLHKPLSPEMIEGSARDALLERDSAPMQALHGATFAGATVERLEPRAATASTASVWKQLGLAFAAPALGLVYVLLLPFAGLIALLALPFWYGGRALARRPGGVKTWLRNVALFFAAPLVGLVYVIALPFVGLGMLAWMGVRAALNRSDTA
ncbi:MAG: response regulator [Betaproteobacteria bacterium]|nr:response regulator [Betaproteobacteria bacterium]MBK7589868.1 response regulator [Betaproteobacteria bacterium]